MNGEKLKMPLRKYFLHLSGNFLIYLNTKFIKKILYWSILQVLALSLRLGLREVDMKSIDFCGKYDF